MKFVLGQLMGGLAVILGFAALQMRTQKRLLAVQTATTVAFCIHYYLIGATSGLMLNLLGIVRNLAYYHKDKPLFSGKKCPIFFSVAMGLVGLLSWQDFYSLFVVLGLVINSYCLSFTNPQNIRKSILVTSPLVLIYDASMLSVGGIIFESVAIISAVIGIVRYRKAAE